MSERSMSPAELRAFLEEGTRTGKLATTRRDGRPHVVPIWFVLDGETLLFTTGRDTVKGRNLLRDPRVSVCVDDEDPPFRFATISGRARCSDGDPELLRWSTRIAERYVGAEQADAFGRRNAVPGELLVRVPFEHVVSNRDVIGW